MRGIRRAKKTDRGNTHRLAEMQQEGIVRDHAGANAQDGRGFGNGKFSREMDAQRRFAEIRRILPVSRPRHAPATRDEPRGKFLKMREGPGF